MNATRLMLLSAAVSAAWCVPADAQVRVQVGPRGVHVQQGQRYYQPGYQPGYVHPHPVQQFTYQFAGRQHLDRLAIELEQRANDLCWEMYRNYQRNPGWRETYAEAYKILQDAKHIHQLVHDQYRGTPNQDHIADDLHEVDQLFHHVERDVAHWQPDRAIAGRQYYNPHDPHGGHMAYHGDLPNKLRAFEDVLHHMMTDYGVRSRLGAAPVPPGSAGSPPPPRP